MQEDPDWWSSAFLCCPLRITAADISLEPPRLPKSQNVAFFLVRKTKNPQSCEGMQPCSADTGSGMRPAALNGISWEIKGMKRPVTRIKVWTAARQLQTDVGLQQENISLFHLEFSHTEKEHLLGALRVRRPAGGERHTELLLVGLHEGIESCTATFSPAQGSVAGAAAHVPPSPCHQTAAISLWMTSRCAPLAHSTRNPFFFGSPHPLSLLRPSNSPPARRVSPTLPEQRWPFIN